MKDFLKWYRLTKKFVVNLEELSEEDVINLYNESLKTNSKNKDY